MTTHGHVAGKIREAIERLRDELDEVREREVDVARALGALGENRVDLPRIARNVVAEGERLRGNLVAEGEDKARLAAEVERLSKLCCVCEGDCCRLARERKAEVSRLRDTISPGDAAAYEEGMAALQTRARELEAALREWREAESSSDCIACCTLDAALATPLSTEAEAKAAKGDGQPLVKMREVEP